MNPMKELKSEFDLFKSLIGNDFQEYNLNKSEPKQHYTQNYPDYQLNGSDDDYTLYESKGVKSDFIRIFRIKHNKKNHYSLGFVFNYLETDTPSMHYNLRFTNAKDEQMYFTSPDMNLLDMKEKMKSINKQLVKLEDKNNENILNIINQEFISKNINELEEVKFKKLKF